MDSILTSIKKLLGIEEEYGHFDNDIIMHVNSVFMTLNQLGIGPEEGFSITTDEQTWFDFLGESKNLEAVKSYVFLKVRLIFDPPTNSSLLEAMKQQEKEYEWRLNVQAEKGA